MRHLNCTRASRCVAGEADKRCNHLDAKEELENSVQPSQASDATAGETDAGWYSRTVVLVRSMQARSVCISTAYLTRSLEVSEQPNDGACASSTVVRWCSTRRNKTTMVCVPPSRRCSTEKPEWCACPSGNNTEANKQGCVCPHHGGTVPDQSQARPPEPRRTSRCH